MSIQIRSTRVLLWIKEKVKVAGKLPHTGRGTVLLQASKQVFKRFLTLENPGRDWSKMPVLLVQDDGGKTRGDHCWWLGTRKVTLGQKGTRLTLSVALAMLSSAFNPVF